MRRSGSSFGEIRAALGISKSSLHYMLRDIELNMEQKELLRQKMVSAGKESPIAHLDTSTRRENGKKFWSEQPEKARLSIAAAARASALTYLPHEQALRCVLESIYGASFRKEQVGGRYFDFASENFLIEHSFDYGKGLGDIIKRFRAAEAVGDLRRRIAFINMKHLGKKRLKRLSELSVEIKSCFSLGV